MSPTMTVVKKIERIKSSEIMRVNEKGQCRAVMIGSIVRNMPENINLRGKVEGEVNQCSSYFR
jgi:hypothetical protein